MLLRALLALLLTVAPASAQFIFSGGGSGGSGTVTTLSVATANGFAGTVATATTTPVITLTTSVTGNVCSNATALSACSTTGTGATVLASTPTLVTPVLGVASGTSLALGGATIGINALAVTGTANVSGNTTLGSAAVLFWSTDAGMSRSAPGVMQFSTNAANAAGSWLATNGTLSGSLAIGGATIGSNALAVNGTVLFNNTVAGTVFTTSSGSTIGSDINVAATRAFYWTGRNVISSPADGNTLLQNNAGTSFTSLQFGGTTSSFPAIKRSTTTLQVRLSDDSADAGITMSTITASGITSVTNTTDSTTTTTGSFQVAGGAAIRKRVFMDGLTASSGLQTAVICQSSAGELIADSVACLASSERFKTIRGLAETGALGKITRLPIYRWNYNEEGIFNSGDWTRERIGPTAEETAAIDPRLVGYGNDGKIRNISTEQLLSLTVQAVQELKADNDNLRAMLTKRAANGG